jgi:dienelactone hydrolase
MSNSHLRNQSPQDMFVRMARDHQPRFQFDAWEGGFEDWKASARPEVRKCLGAFPDTVEPNPELQVEWEEDGLRKQRWLIDVNPNLSATVLVFFPADPKGGEDRPALLCWHGHGEYGKESVMGNRSTPDRHADIELLNYDYGLQMAQAGFVTYAVDWLSKGALDDTRTPNRRIDQTGRDWCNIYYLHATMFGMTSISINVGIGMAATTFVSGLPGVDPARLGVMGLSGGGTMTLWSAFCDERIKAAEIICYSDLWEAFGMRDINYCGMQVAPGLYALVDLPDAQGLLAPKPLLIDIGVRDTCFSVETALQCYRKLEKIYAAAGAADHLDLDLHPNEHGWGGNKAVEFFKEAL